MKILLLPTWCFLIPMDETVGSAAVVAAGILAAAGIGTPAYETLDIVEKPAAAPPVVAAEDVVVAAAVATAAAAVAADLVLAGSDAAEVFRLLVVR